MKNFFSLIFKMPICIFLILANTCVFANHKTNQNNVTDFFDKSIHNKEEAYKITRDLRRGGLDGIRDRSSEAKVEGHEGAESKKQELSKINAIDLDHAGKDKRISDYEFYDDGEFEVNFKKPSNAQHLKYAESLTERTDKLMKEIIASFKEFDIDCKTVKGPIEKEPTYYIELERQEEKANTHYDQYFCENLRNTYNCTDSASIKCLQKGMLWKDWQQPITIKVPGRELVGNGYHFFYSAHVADKVFEMKLFAPNSANKSDQWGRIKFDSVPEMRRYLADKHGLTSDHITPDMSFGWEGGIYGLGGKGYAWNTYIITYQIRDGEEICEKWSDSDWTERCVING